MFVSTPFVIFTLTAVGRVVSEIYKKGDKAVLSPGSVSGPITSITWKHGPDIAVEWYGEEPIEYRDFKGRCELNNNTGALTITNLSLNDSGRYTAEINNRIMKTTEIKVITAVPKPTIKKQCNPEVTQCTLTCDASITADMGTVIYSWETGDRQIPEASNNQLNITKDDTESVGKLISCQLENPVSSERSDDITDLFTNESSVGGITAAVVTPLFLIAAALVGFICWRKRRPGNADQSWCQYFACFNPRNCLNCGRTNQQTQEENPQEPSAERAKLMSENGDAIKCSELNKTHSQDQNPGTSSAGNEAERAKLMSENGDAVKCSELNKTHSQDQNPGPSSTGNEAATSSASQTVKNQDQPEPEPTDTNKGAEKPESTSNIENETRSDQTPAEPTGTSSEAATSSESQTVKNQDQPEPEPTGTNKEAETSAGAPNAEEPPDHHHQQEDETTE